ncbi:LLM class flavin-dependent oxidoreductase, partial [Microbacterium lacticum]
MSIFTEHTGRPLPPVIVGAELALSPSCALDSAAVVKFVLALQRTAFEVLVVTSADDARTAEVDTVSVAAYCARLSSRLYVVPEVSARSEPFHVASQLATLDYVSQGRSGWVLADESHDPQFARVLQALWDSWDDDAVIRDPLSVMSRQVVESADGCGS